jgi:hypothetical protein
MSQPQNKRSVTKSGVNLLKKLVLDNYQEPAQEQREFDRQSVVGEITVTLLDEAGQPSTQTKAFVRDTSKHGCGLWSRVAMPTGRTVMLQGQGVDGAGSVQRMATVCHCRGSAGTGFAVGVKFAAGSGDAKAA